MGENGVFRGNLSGKGGSGILSMGVVVWAGSSAAVAATALVMRSLAFLAARTLAVRSLAFLAVVVHQ